MGSGCVIDSACSGSSCVSILATATATATTGHIGSADNGGVAVTNAVSTGIAATVVTTGATARTTSHPNRVEAGIPTAGAIRGDAIALCASGTHG